MPASDCPSALKARPWTQPSDTQPRFRRLTTGVVIEPVRDLHWAAAGLDDAMPWRNAFDAIAALRLAGHADWRLPTIDELIGLVDWQRHDPAIDTASFDALPTWYWTASEVAGVPGCAWFVDFGRGMADFHPLDSRARVRAVRNAG